jgi:hypothetical protein
LLDHGFHDNLLIGPADARDIEVITLASHLPSECHYPNSWFLADDVIQIGKLLGGHEREDKRIEMGSKVPRRTFPTLRPHGVSPSFNEQGFAI